MVHILYSEVLPHYPEGLVCMVGISVGATNCFYRHDSTLLRMINVLGFKQNDQRLAAARV